MTANTFAASATTIAPTLTNIEIVNLDADGTAATTLNLVNAQQITNVNNLGSSADAAFTNIASGAALGVNAVGANSTFTYASTQAEATLTATNVSTGIITVNRVTALNLVSAGTANDLQGLAGSATTVNVSGSTDLDMNAVGAAITTLNASAFTGDLIADISNQVSNTTATSVVGGSGDDIFLVDGVAVGTGVVASVLNGGDGLNVLNAAYAVSQANVVDAGSIAIENIQVVELVAEDSGTTVDVGLDASLVGGLGVVAVAGQDADASNTFTVEGLTADQAVVIEEAAFGVTLELSGDTDVTDVIVGLTLGEDSTAVIDINNAGSLETVNLVVDGNSYNDVDFGAGDFATISIAGGAAGKTLAVGVAGAVVDAETFDASGLASNLTATFGVADQSIVGGSGNDTFNFGANLATNDTVDGGAGTNTVAFTLGSALTGPRLSNIQNLDVTTAVTSNTISLQNSSGVETINIVANSGAPDQASFTNLDASLAAVNVQIGINTLSVATAAGQVADATLTIGESGVGFLTVASATINNGGSLSVLAAEDTFAVGTETITVLTTNATSLTLGTVGDDALVVTSATAASATSFVAEAVTADVTAATVTANSAASVDVSATGAVAQVGDSSSGFNAIRDLVVSGSEGGTAIFEGTRTSATASLTVDSITLTTDDQGSTVTSTLSVLATGADKSATVSALNVTNGVDSAITQDLTLEATGEGAATITEVNVVNNGEAAADLVDLILDFDATGTQSIGALNVAVAEDAEVNVGLTTIGANTVVLIEAGALTGAGALDITTTDITELDLSELTVSGFSGALSVVGDLDLDVLVGTAYGETLDVSDNVSGATVTGGQGSDTILLDGTGAATDTVVYTSQADSTGTVYDYITAFEAGATGDEIDLSALGLAGAAYGGTTTDATITYTSASDVTFTIAAADAATFFGSDTALSQASGTNATIVFVDANLSGGWEADSDMAIVLVGNVGALDPAVNFVWA